MNADDSAPRGFSLKRWSQRKLEASRAASAPAPEPPAPALPTSGSAAPAPPSETPPVDSGASAVDIAPAAALPPIESLTIDSDFSVFLGPSVDPALRLEALKRLFRDPRFNVMDGLDVYIDDYSIPDPLEPEIARRLAHARYVFDPPPTRVNEAGVVEDIREKEAAIDADAPQEPAANLPEATTMSDAATAAEPAPLPPAVARSPDRDSASGESGPREGSEPARR